MSFDMDNSYRVLLIDDDPDQAEMVSEYLRMSGFQQVDWVGDLHSLWDKLQTQAFDIMLLDYVLPDGTGLDALAGMAERELNIPVVMVTGQGDERVAVQALQRGAADYLIKTGDYLLTLPSLIRKTVNSYSLQQSFQKSLQKIQYQATLLNNVRDAIVVWNLEGQITYWSPAATMLYGWSADERLGRAVNEVYLQAFTPPIVVPREGDTVGQHIVRRYETASRRTIWVSSRISVLRDPALGNRTIGFMDVTHDITKRVEAEHALRSERNFVSAVLDTVGSLVVVIDDEGRIVRFNRAFEQLQGSTFEEIRGKYAWDILVVPEESAGMMRVLQSIYSGEFPRKHESSLKTRSRGVRRIAWSNTAMTGRNGQVEFVIATGLDITEQRAAQTHLTQVARLTTLGELASGVAHQINNPLTTIIADAQILLRKMPPDMDGRDSAEAIEQAGWRVQDVVQRLLDFSRPSTDSFKLLSVNQTVQAALQLIGVHIEANGVSLETNLDPNLPQVRGNPRQLEDLWVNLLLLARDATAEGQDHHIQVNSHLLPTGEVALDICDDGLPVPLEARAAIFEPNFVGSSFGRGTGMELSICREIVRQHSGRISVESAQGHDTIFRVTLRPEDELR